jgi:hypothetical protein
MTRTPGWQDQRIAGRAVERMMFTIMRSGVCQAGGDSNGMFPCVYGCD